MLCFIYFSILFEMSYLPELLLLSNLFSIVNMSSSVTSSNLQDWIVGVFKYCSNISLLKWSSSFDRSLPIFTKYSLNESAILCGIVNVSPLYWNLLCSSLHCLCLAKVTIILLRQMTYQINTIIILLINNFVCILSRHGI